MKSSKFSQLLLAVVINMEQALLLGFCCPVLYLLTSLVIYLNAGILSVNVKFFQIELEAEISRR